MRYGDDRIFGLPKFIKFFIAAAGIIAGFILSRLFVVMPFTVQDNSMNPVLNKGDYVLLLKIGSPKNGDIVLCKSPVEQDKVVLKRLIISGEKKIEIRNKRIYINDAEYKNIYGQIKDRRVFPEYFSNRDNMKEITMKTEEVFLLGDNIDYSMDSREFGPVNKENIIGRMIYKF